MDLNDLVLVSVDDHVIEPGDMWDAHLPAKYKDEAPKQQRYEIPVEPDLVSIHCGHS